jgi:hypothetical protein
MREWLDEVGPRVLGLICLLTVLNTLLIIGLYFRIDASPTEATESSPEQLTGDSPDRSIEASSRATSSPRVPLSTDNLQVFFTKMMEPFDSGAEGLKLPTQDQIDDAVESQNIQSTEARQVYEMLKQAYAASNRPLPPIEPPIE